MTMREIQETIQKYETSCGYKLMCAIIITALSQRFTVFKKENEDIFRFCGNNYTLDVSFGDNVTSTITVYRNNIEIVTLKTIDFSFDDLFAGKYN